MATTREFNFTNMDPSPVAGYFRTLVPLSTGEVANLSTLKTGRRIKFDGVERDTFWELLGHFDHDGTWRDSTSHIDGSVWLAVAEFAATIPGEVASPTAPTVVAEMVAASNSEPTLSVDTTAISSLQVEVEYEDDEGATISYGPVDVLGEARLGNNHGNAYSRDQGGRHLEFAEFYMGRGRHHKALRLLGHNNQGTAQGNPPVEVQGLLHVLSQFEWPHGESWGTCELEFGNDAPYPYPSEPCDGGSRDPFDASRPTRLVPPEALESPVNRHIANLRVRFSRSDAGTIHARPFYVDVYATGAGPFGAISQDGDWWDIDILGLANAQNWGSRWAISFDSSAEAERIARRPHTHQGTPTNATWASSLRTGTLPDPVPESVEMAGIDIAYIQDVPAALVSSQFRGGPAAYSSFMAEREHAWDLMGAKEGVSGGGNHRQIGFLQELSVFSCGDVWRMYRLGAQSMREYTARKWRIWQIENATRWTNGLLDPGGLQQTTMIKGSGFDGISYNTLGRKQQRSNRSSQNSLYGGVNADFSNPDTREEPWHDVFDLEHYGSRLVWLYGLMTQNPWSLRIHKNYTWMVYASLPVIDGHGSNTYLGWRSPSENANRGEFRPMLEGLRAYVYSGDPNFMIHLGYRISSYLGGRANWPYFGKTGPTGRDDIKGRQCGYTGDLVDFRENFYVSWQSSAVNTPALLLFAYLAGHPQFAANTTIQEARSVALRFLKDGCKLHVMQASVINPAIKNAGAATGKHDSCWSAIAAGMTAQNQANGWNCTVGPIGCAADGYAVTKLHKPDLVNGTQLDMEFENVAKGWNSKNDGEHQHARIGYMVAQIFRNTTETEIPGFIARAEQLAELHSGRFPGTASGYDWTTQTGWACGTFHTSGPVIDPPPVVDFEATPRSGAIPLDVDFDGSASVVGNNQAAATVDWWADKLPSGTYGTPTATFTGWENGRTWSHTYTEAGSYSPRLRVTDSEGQRTPRRKDDYIVATSGLPALPSPDFTADPTTVAPFEEVTLINVTDPVTPPVDSWSWKADGEEFSTDHDAVFETSAPGTYDITLSATNAAGTSTSAATEVTVSDPGNPVVSFTVEPRAGRPPLRVTVQNTGSNWLFAAWAFAGSTTTGLVEQFYPDTTPIEVVYPDTGTFQIVLVLSNVVGSAYEAVLVDVFTGSEIGGSWVLTHATTPGELILKLRIAEGGSDEEYEEAEGEHRPSTARP